MRDLARRVQLLEEARWEFVGLGFIVQGLGWRRV